MQQHWLDLSRSYTAMDLNDHAISTLQAGLKAIPESAEINFSLGKLYQFGRECGKGLAVF